MPDDPNDSPPPNPENEAAAQPAASSPPPESEATATPGSPPSADNPQPGAESTPAANEQAREAFFAKWTKDETKTDPPAEPVEEKPAPETAATPPPAEPPEPLELLTQESAAKLSPGEVRRKVNRLLDRVKQAEAKVAEQDELAQLGTDVITTAKSAGWTPAQYVQVMQNVSGAMAGDPAALARVRQAFDIKPTQAAPAWGQDDEAWITDAVAAGDMTVEAAKQLRQRMTQRQAAPPAPAPAPPPPAVPAPRQANPAALNEQIGEALERATAGLPETDVAKVDEQVKKELIAHRKKHPNLPREAYPAVIEAIASGIVARHKAAAPRAPVIRQALTPTPSSPSTPGGTKASPKDEFFSRW